jgi:hypothetical protein
MSDNKTFRPRPPTPPLRPFTEEERRELNALFGYEGVAPVKPKRDWWFLRFFLLGVVTTIAIGLMVDATRTEATDMEPFISSTSTMLEVERP